MEEKKEDFETIQTETTRQNNSVLQSIKDIITEFLKNPHFNETVRNFTESLNEKTKIKANLETEKLSTQEKLHHSNLKYWKIRFIKESVVITAILGTVIYLSSIDKIDNCTLGTLLGSIIGYAIGNFNSFNGPK